MPETTAPLGVKVVAAVVWISGVVGLFRVGQFVWYSGENETVNAVGGIYGYFSVIFIGFVVNLIIISVAGALLRGSRAARMVATIAIIIHLLQGIATLFAPHYIVGVSIGTWIGIALNVLGLYLLWVQGKKHFTKFGF